MPSLFFFEGVADFLEDFEGLLFDGWLGWGFFLSWGFFAWFKFLQVVEEAHDREDYERCDEEDDDGLNEVSDHYLRIAERDAKACEIDSACDYADDWRDDVAYERVYNRCERAADDDADSHAHYVTASDELLKFLDKVFHNFSSSFSILVHGKPTTLS